MTAGVFTDVRYYEYPRIVKRTRLGVRDYQHHSVEFNQVLHFRPITEEPARYGRDHP